MNDGEFKNKINYLGQIILLLVFVSMLPRSGTRLRQYDRYMTCFNLMVIYNIKSIHDSTTLHLRKYFSKMIPNQLLIQ